MARGVAGRGEQGGKLGAPRRTKQPLIWLLHLSGLPYLTQGTSGYPAAKFCGPLANHTQRLAQEGFELSRGPWTRRDSELSPKPLPAPSWESFPKQPACRISLGERRKLLRSGG